ncbi:MAG TPA: hypothetical protein DDY25_07180, partial [Peptococcaceae bacterium]|jgi:hypothetical protein|nr:hypothetical protein [Peptococcaceae bacterium]
MGPGTSSRSRGKIKGRDTKGQPPRAVFDKQKQDTVEPLFVPEDTGSAPFIAVNKSQIKRGRRIRLKMTPK